jgi:hypothetical protein
LARAQAFVLKAEAKRIMAKAARAGDRQDQLLQRARELDAEADARLFEAEARHIEESAAAIAKRIEAAGTSDEH